MTFHYGDQVLIEGNARSWSLNEPGKTYPGIVDGFDDGNLVVRLTPPVLHQGRTLEKVTVQDTRVRKVSQGDAQAA